MGQSYSMLPFGQPVVSQQVASQPGSQPVASQPGSQPIAFQVGIPPVTAESVMRTKEDVDTYIENNYKPGINKIINKLTKIKDLYSQNKTIIDNYEKVMNTSIITNNTTLANLKTTCKNKVDEAKIKQDSIIPAQDASIRTTSSMTTNILEQINANIYKNIYDGVQKENDTLTDNIQDTDVLYSKDTTKISNVTDLIDFLNPIKSYFIIAYFILVNIAAIFIYYSKNINIYQKIILTLFIFVYPFLVYFLQNRIHKWYST